MTLDALMPVKSHLNVWMWRSPLFNQYNPKWRKLDKILWPLASFAFTPEHQEKANSCSFKLFHGNERVIQCWLKPQRPLCAYCCWAVKPKKVKSKPKMYHIGLWHLVPFPLNSINYWKKRVFTPFLERTSRLFLLK